MDLSNKKERLEVVEDIRKRYSKIDFPNPTLEPVWRGRRPNTRIEGKWAIYDQKTGTDYAIATDQYGIIFHEEVIKLVEDVVAQMPEFGKVDICPYLYCDGGRIEVVAKFGERPHEVKKGDWILPTVRVRGSYDLGWKNLGSFGAHQVICSNGAAVGEIFKTFSKRHLHSFDINDMKASILEGMQLFSTQVGLWKKWAETKVNELLYNRVWEELPFSEAEKEKIEKLPQTGTRLLLPEALKQDELTMWLFFGVTTQYLTHEVRSQLRRTEDMPAITRAFEKAYATVR